jgi:hypothetical protein
MTEFSLKATDSRLWVLRLSDSAIMQRPSIKTIPPTSRQKSITKFRRMVNRQYVDPQNRYLMVG